MFKVTLQYLLNLFIQSNTLLTLSLIKIDPKMRGFKNLEGFWKTWYKF